MSKIGIMGGTFDPIHIGHLFIAENVCEILRLDKILFIPTGTPPHKNAGNVTDKLHRYAMTAVAVAHNDKFDVSPIEFERDTTCYTADTVEILGKQYPETQWYYIVGADALLDIPKWKNPERFINKVKIVAVDRLTGGDVKTNEAAQRLINDFGAEVAIVNLPLLEISSTDIRRRLKNNQTVNYMLTDDVIEYITDRGLYK